MQMTKALGAYCLRPAPTAATERGVLFAPVEPGAPLLRRSFPPLIGNLQPLGEVVVERNGQPAVISVWLARLLQKD